MIAYSTFSFLRKTYITFDYDVVSLLVTTSLFVSTYCLLVQQRLRTNLPVCVEGRRHGNQVVVDTPNRWSSALILWGGDNGLRGRASSAS